MRHLHVVELYQLEDATWLERARNADLDVLLNLTSAAVTDAMTQLASAGVWFFQHQDPQHPDHCLRPLLTDSPITATTLQRQLAGGTREVLHEGCFATVAFSPALNHDVVVNGSADWVARVCQQWLDSGVLPTAAAPPPPAALPDSWVCRGQRRLRFGLAYAREHWRSLTRYGQWNVGMIRAPVHELLAGGSTPSSDAIEWLPPPRHGRFYADPFAIHVQGRLHVFVEDLDLNGAGRGHIAVFSADDSGTLRGPVPVLEAPFHLSYPGVFESAGEIYCVPETFENDEVALFRARNFPHDWERVTTLISGLAVVDPTLHNDGTRWWLFATTKESGSETKLMAWWAPSLEGKWTAHRWNPLKTDVRSARPAGPLFEHDGRLYRPAQDCSEGYGGAVQIQEVTELSPTVFHERTVRRLAPDPAGPYPHGLHTIAGSGDVTVIDGVRNAIVLRSCVRQVAARSRRLSSRLGRLPLRLGIRIASSVLALLLPGRRRALAPGQVRHPS
ncbi:MAG: hypothetical protein AAF581_09540 [Planctomycetota bacterium]